MTVVWITGLPSSGKSTLAARVQARIGGVILDSDAVRVVLGDRDYAGRDGFYRVLASLAALIARQGTVAIVAATAPRRAHRAVARELAPRFVEVYVDTPLVECERRDAKGLYAAARRGEVVALPGLQTPYEPPLAPDVVAHDGADDAAVAAIAQALRASAA